MGNPESGRPPGEAADFEFPPEGEATFEESGEQPIEAPPPAEPQEREKGFLERLRSYRPLRPIVLGFALEAAALGWHVGEKIQEKRAIEQLQSAVKAEQVKVEPLRARGERAKQLFGDNLPSFLDPGQRLEEIQRSERSVHQVAESFSWFDKKRNILGKPAEKSRTESLESSTNETLTTTDFVTHPREGAEERFTQETFRHLLPKMYPKGWIEGEVASIEQSGEVELMGERYGLGEKAEALASCIGGEQEEKSRIVFHKPSQKGFYTSEIIAVLSHELGHANDWKKDNKMTDAERLDLLLAVAERLDDSDRLQSSYVESIKNKDQQLERYVKATEYWAEICEEYFTYPQLLNYKDYALVEQHLKKQDPTFERKRFVEAKIKLCNEAALYGERSNRR